MRAPSGRPAKAFIGADIDLRRSCALTSGERKPFAMEELAAKVRQALANPTP